MYVAENAPKIINNLLEEFGKNLDSKKLNHLLEKYKENILKQEHGPVNTSFFGRGHQIRLKLIFDAQEFVLTITETELDGKRIVEIRD